MMKYVTSALAATTMAMTVTPASAQQTSTFTVTGNVAASCGAIGNDTIAIGQIGIGTDGTLNTGQSKSTGSSNVWCNGLNTKIKVSHTALLTGDTSPAPSGFTKKIDYTPNVSFAGTNFGDGEVTLGAKTGAMIVSANNLTAADGKPLAGDYSGAITVVLTPAI